MKELNKSQLDNFKITFIREYKEQINKLLPLSDHSPSNFPFYLPDDVQFNTVVDNRGICALVFDTDSVLEIKFQDQSLLSTDLNYHKKPILYWTTNDINESSAKNLARQRAHFDAQFYFPDRNNSIQQLKSIEEISNKNQYTLESKSETIRKLRTLDQQNRVIIKTLHETEKRLNIGTKISIIIGVGAIILTTISLLVIL